jgi:hypothetical protein
MTIRDVAIAIGGCIGGLVIGAATLMLAVAVRSAGGRRWRKG